MNARNKSIFLTNILEKFSKYLDIDIICTLLYTIIFLQGRPFVI